MNASGMLVGAAIGSGLTLFVLWATAPSIAAWAVTNYGDRVLQGSGVPQVLTQGLSQALAPVVRQQVRTALHP